MSKVLEVNDNTFKAAVLESDMPVLVDFWAPWCGPCRMMHPVLESVSEKVASKMKVAKLNTDENQSTASQYSIQAIPCMIVFKNGAEVDRIVGFNPEEALLKQLEKYMA